MRVPRAAPCIPCEHRFARSRPLTQAKGRVHSPILPHSRSPCHSERSEESPPFAERKGVKGDAPSCVVRVI